ncbi:Actin cytoskeleton-regulatory complex pan-like protein [Heracleum sosnowskyi]|uniref:Actin cytoskeleton-regulatory complex pan-like protein n=1 Tax=Heracleum sosnowskyi TaxID=360622 RepID=A0AAD8MW43_9APIA|nr:Actin cytoskeleton-regulatory complex pan-like protein [Heracleum sosnowskyi]
MKITRNLDPPSTQPSKTLNPSSQDSDLPKLRQPSIIRKPPHRKPRTTAAGVRLKRDGAPVGKRSRPETPLSKWKVNEVVKDAPVEDNSVTELTRKNVRSKNNKGGNVSISARKLAAGLWRLQLPEAPTSVGDRLENEQLGLQQSTSGHIEAACLTHRDSKLHSAHLKDLTSSPRSACGHKNGSSRKMKASLHNSNPAMEGATKWDPVFCKASDEVQSIYSHSKPIHEQVGAVSMVSALELELEQARGRIHELETERRSSKKKIEQFLKKLSEERAVWRSREHEKIRAIIDDIKADLNRERKNRQRTEIVNSKLVSELGDSKISAKRFMQDFEKERKARELIEEVCDELAKEIGEDKAELEALKRESLNLRDEVEDERRMLQMAEVWREERVQMKLVDAKVTLEEKYAQMHNIIADLETFLSSKRSITDVEELGKAELLRQVAASVNIKDISAFTYEPSNPEDIFSIFEDVKFGESNERETEHCGIHSPASHASEVRTVSREAKDLYKKEENHNSNAYPSQNGDLEDEDSGWETVSHVDDQGSSYSPDGSDPSVNKIRCESSVSGSGTEWEDNAGGETPTEIIEVCSVPTGQLKKVSSISRLWRTLPNNGENYKIIAVDGLKGRLSHGRLSNGTVTSPDHGSGNGGFSPTELTGQWSSPESRNHHINRGTKGCIEWPRGSQKKSLKSKLLEARMETQKIQLRQVLKQKI